MSQDWLNELVGWLEAGAKYAIYLALLFLWHITGQIGELREETANLDRRIMVMEVRENLAQSSSGSEGD